VPEARSVLAALIEPEELEILVPVDLEDVVLVARLDADDVSLAHILREAGVQDLRHATRDQVQLVVFVVVAIVLSTFPGHPEEAGRRRLAPLRLGLGPEVCLVCMNHRHGTALLPIAAGIST
jgi:hypothetical protein